MSKLRLFFPKNYKLIVHHVLVVSKVNICQRLLRLTSDLPFSLRERHNTIDNVVKCFLKVSNRRGNGDKVESADINAQN